MSLRVIHMQKPCSVKVLMSSSAGLATVLDRLVNTSRTFRCVQFFTSVWHPDNCICPRRGTQAMSCPAKSTLFGQADMWVWLGFLRFFGLKVWQGVHTSDCFYQSQSLAPPFPHASLHSFIVCESVCVTCSTLRSHCFHAAGSYPALGRLHCGLHFQHICGGTRHQLHAAHFSAHSPAPAISFHQSLQPGQVMLLASKQGGLLVWPDHVIASIRHHRHYTEVLRVTHPGAYRDVLLDVCCPMASLGH